MPIVLLRMYKLAWRWHVPCRGTALEREFTTMASLNTKLVFSALSVALLATPAIAGDTHRQPLSQNTMQSNDFTNNDVIVHDRVVGRDPDLKIRSEISRESDSLHGE
jgi:hypothetical protein